MPITKVYPHGSAVSIAQPNPIARPKVITPLLIPEALLDSCLGEVVLLRIFVRKIHPV